MERDRRAARRLPRRSPAFATPSLRIAGRYACSTFGVDPGDYDAILIGKDNKPEARAAFTIVARNAVPSLASDATVRAGQPLRVRWRDAPGAAHDWIGIYAAGDPDLAAYRAFIYTEASVERRRRDRHRRPAAGRL